MIDKKNDNFLMSFGKMPIANNFLHENDFSKEFFYEMKVGFNEEYSLFKLLEHPKPEQMFNSKYPFLTSSSNYIAMEDLGWEFEVNSVSNTSWVDYSSIGV